jgi:pilus assembly protein Flp/PilA
MEDKKMAISKFFKKFLKDEEGATAVEYAVMIVLIIVVCLGVITLLGTEVREAFNTVAETLSGR